MDSPSPTLVVRFRRQSHPLPAHGTGREELSPAARPYRVLTCATTCVHPVSWRTTCSISSTATPLRRQLDRSVQDVQHASPAHSPRCLPGVRPPGRHPIYVIPQRARVNPLPWSKHLPPPSSSCSGPPPPLSQSPHPPAPVLVDHSPVLVPHAPVLVPHAPVLVVHSAIRR